jgi:hypothetical protein
MAKCRVLQQSRILPIGSAMCDRADHGT